MTRREELLAVKERFGGLVFLDYTGYNLRSAYILLGTHVRQQVHKILWNRLERLNGTVFTEQIHQARECGITLRRKAKDRHTEPRLRGAVRDYLDCLAAWTDGAGLADFDHPALAAHRPLGSLDLALFLQHDSSGCQTGMYRQADGAVILWHTEEDIEFEIGSGFDQLRLAAFKVDDGNGPVTIHAFIYPDLLPGPAFAWRSDGFAQAVDSLHTRAFPDIQHGILANVATWLTLRLGATRDPGEVIDAMRPYFDGYALNAVYSQEEWVRGCKYEFADDRIIPYCLDGQPSSYLYQANIFCQKAHPWVQELEDLNPYERRLYEQRVKRTERALQNKDSKPSKAGDMQFIFNLLTSRAGKGWGYANTLVKAYFIYRLDRQGAEIWLGHGPALSGDEVLVIHTPTG